MTRLLIIDDHAVVRQGLVQAFCDQGFDSIETAGNLKEARAKIAAFVASADVQKQMETLGLTTANAQDRVAALTDEEVQRIAGKIDSAPAGASSTGTAWVVAAVIAIAILVYIYWK